MNEWVVAVAIAVFGAIYAAGRIVAGTRKEVEHAKADINLTPIKEAVNDLDLCVQMLRLG